MLKEISEAMGIMAVFAVKGAKGTACSGYALDSKYCHGKMLIKPGGQE